MKRLICAMLSAALLLACAACGTPSAESTAQAPAASPSPSSSPESTLSGQTPASKPPAEPVPSPSPSTEPTPASEPSAEPAPAPEPEPEETVDPADHIFPDLEAFFNRAADENRSNDARGWKYYFEKLQPYDQLEAVEAELIALLQEPRWQLELVDKETSVYESGDINPVDTYYFRYTGTAGLTEIWDVLGVRLDNVIVTFYHIPVHGYYDVSVWRSPELDVVDPGCQVSAETDAVDPASKLLPDIEKFLYHSASTAKEYGDHGYQRQWNGSHPLAAYETVKQELLDLLAEDRYQLELVESTINPHYSGIEMQDYFYVYTGTSEEIAMLIDEYEEHEFNVRLRITPYPEYGYFKMSVVFSRGFDLEDPGTRTTRNIDHDSDGGVLTAPPETSSGSGSDFWEKCSSCHGSGDCTHCGGDDKVKKFQAGLGWVEQNCTFCTGGRCRYCGGTGKG